MRVSSCRVLSYTIGMAGVGGEEGVENKGKGELKKRTCAKKEKPNP